MKYKQKSLKNSLYFKGIGAHSGAKVELEVLPADAGHGIKFYRTDIDEYIDADFRNVTDTSLCTIISNENGATVATIEHLMSALYGFGIDNALIKVSGQEMPILDGSAKVYSDAIEEVGVVDLESTKQFIKVLKEVSIHVGDKWISLSPSELAHRTTSPLLEEIDLLADRLMSLVALSVIDAPELVLLIFSLRTMSPP